MKKNRIKRIQLRLWITWVKLSHSFLNIGLFVLFRKKFRKLSLLGKSALVLALLLVSIATSFLVNYIGVSAQTLMFAKDDYIGGSSQFGEIQIGSDLASIQLQKGVTGTWGNQATPAIQLPPSLNSRDGIMNLEYGPNDTLFLMTAMAEQCHFYRYDIEKQNYKTLYTPPVGCGVGSLLVYDGLESVYYAPAGAVSTPSDRLFKYSIKNDSWVEKTAAPSMISANSSAILTGSGNNKYIYMFRGMGSPAFLRYSIASDSWESLLPFPTSGSVAYGIALVWDGVSSIYAIANLSGEYKKFDMLTNTWSNLTTVPSSSNANYRLEYVSANNTILAFQDNTWGDYSYHLRSYDVATRIWTNIKNPPSMGSVWNSPSNFTYDGSRYAYAVSSTENTIHIFRYDTQLSTWNQNSLSTNGDSTGYHQQLIYDNSRTAYYYGGSYTSSSDRVYKINLDTYTTSLVGAQGFSRTGMGGVVVGGLIYVLPMPGYTYFQTFDINTGAVADLAATPFAVSSGAGIVNGNDGYLYAIFGGSRTSFYRYSIAGGTWSALASLPQPEGNGGGIAILGRRIYVLAGNQSSYLMSYNMDTNVWSSIYNMPSGAIDFGGFIISDQSKYLYLGLSNRTDATTRIVYRYDTVTSEFQRIADTPTNVQPYASGFYDTVNDKLYLSQGRESPSLWDWSPNASSYKTSGTWYSKTYDLKQVETWQSISSNIGGNGSAQFYTRSSADSNIWSDWRQVVGGLIDSPVNRYLELKVVLSGDGSSTPIVSNIAINHTQETTPPSLPSQMKAFDKKDGNELMSGQTYEHQHPYFSWNGSSDGNNGSGVDGYYVYFGVDSNANPAISGSYQKESNYTVSTPMTAGSTYYLRIKSRDSLGNVSPAATFFSYRYFYISPPGSIIKTSTSDFTEGINSNVAIDEGAMKLEAATNGIWSTGAMSMLPDSSYGSAEVVVDDYLYVARGFATNTFWRYNTVSQNWNVMNNIPGNVSLGSAMAYDGSRYIYLMAGNTTNNFYRYDVNDNTWVTITKLPSNSQIGSDIKYVGNNKFVILFASIREFYMYDASSGEFTNLQSYPVSITDSGSGMWFDGSDSVYVYMGSTSWDQAAASRLNMAKYSISTDSWRMLSGAPVSAMYMQNNLAYDGRGGLYIFAHNMSDNLDKRQRALRYDIAKDVWSEIAPLEAQIYNGSIASDNKRYIYILPSASSGITTRKIIRYDTWTNTYNPNIKSIDVMDRVAFDSHINAWQWTAGNSTTAVYDGMKYSYVLGGSESNGSWARFVKYDYKTGETIYLPPPPIIGVGGSLGYVGGKLFYMPAKSTKDFYHFDETQNRWIRMTDLPVAVYRPGTSSLVTVGNYLYVFAGNGRVLYRYTPNGSGGVWDRQADAPNSILAGSMVYNPDNNTIYVIRSNGTNSFYSYDVSTNTWSTKANLPGTSSYGSTMTYQAGRIYAQLGNTTNTSYIYDVAGDSWVTGITSPDTFRWGGVSIKVSAKSAISFSGDASPDVWVFNYPDANQAYAGLATHISQPYVVSGMFDYAGITAQVDLPENTSIELWTRSSGDGVNWSDWLVADNLKKYSGSISARPQSIPKMYTQVKLTLQSDDNINTPTVDSYSLSYYYDVDPPTNPSVIEVYSDESKGTKITNNTWYNHPKPVFDWPSPGQPGGATDGPLGSNLAGYWVYLGTDDTASPQTAGVFVSETEFQADLSIPGNYYLRIQAQDMTGNVDGNIYAPFIYKFDNQAPANPALITVTPSGFTSRDNYSFEWPSAYDANSGVAGYCYHTGATSGPFSIEICQPGLTLKDVSVAYRTGTNVFYVRAYDNAGNYSSAYSAASYYYSTDPPGPVTNLRAIPPSSPQNMFAFAWDLPSLYSGDPDQMSYCYSINVLPSALNTTCSSDRFISAFKAATQQGTNIIYVVAKDEAGAANWNNFAFSNFIANTVSPGIPLNLMVNDTSDRVTNRWSLTLTWDKPTFEGTGIKNYIIERSEDGHVFFEIGNTSTLAFVDMNIESGKTYYYRVKAADNVDNRGGASGVVSRAAQGNFATPPQIVVQPSAVAGFDQARITWATSRESTSFVYYGTSPDDLSQSKGSLELVSDHSMIISGLLPSKVYYYRVQSFDNSRSYQLKDAYSSIATLKTTDAAQILRVESSDITASTAVISWQTSIPTTSKIEYGLNSSYGLVMDDGEGGYLVDHTMKLTGLSSGTPYHFRIASGTEFGSVINSDDYNFKTIERPIISNIRFQPIDDEATAATKVTWNTNVPTSSTVKYNALGVNLEVSLSDLVTSHEIILRDLASDTKYSINIDGRDQYGNLAASSVQTWHSKIDTRPPLITDMNLSVTVVDSSAGKKAQLIATWKTDEPATSQIAFGPASSDELSSKTPLDTDPTTNHVVVISNLNLADVYKVQAISRDLNGNTVYSSKVTIVTPDKEVDVLDSVLDLMLRLFRL